jgi:hypothetical protein
MSESIRKDHSESVRNFYRKQGALTEQQRIIKLLEQYQVLGVDSKTRLMLDEDALIALIKRKSQKDNENVVILTKGETND